MKEKEQIEKLLQPRYKVIADYPGSHLNNGEIITPNVDEKYMDDYDLSKYPAIFKPLSWWEDRLPEDMPEYLKGITGEVEKVEKYDFDTDTIYLEGGYPFSLKLHLRFRSPATPDEYTSYLTNNKI
jgi:hypothetical protein